MISGSHISGTLKHVTDYTWFSDKADEQEGNFIALHVDSNIEGATYTVEIKPGKVGHPIELDSDQTIILQVSDNDQKVIVTASKAGHGTVKKVYDLKDLVLQSA